MSILMKFAQSTKVFDHEITRDIRDFCSKQSLWENPPSLHLYTTLGNNASVPAAPSLNNLTVGRSYPYRNLALSNKSELQKWNLRCGMYARFLPALWIFLMVWFCSAWGTEQSMSCVFCMGRQMSDITRIFYPVVASVHELEMDGMGWWDDGMGEWISTLCMRYVFSHGLAWLELGPRIW